MGLMKSLVLALLFFSQAAYAEKVNNLNDVLFDLIRSEYIFYRQPFERMDMSVSQKKCVSEKFNSKLLKKVINKRVENYISFFPSNESKALTVLNSEPIRNFQRYANKGEYSKASEYAKDFTKVLFIDEKNDGVRALLGYPSRRGLRDYYIRFQSVDETKIPVYMITLRQRHKQQQDLISNKLMYELYSACNLPLDSLLIEAIR